MAKRRKRNNSPDLPEATLARARKEAKGESVDPEPTEDETIESNANEAKERISKRRSRRRAAPQPIQFGDQPHRKSSGTVLDSAVIADRLSNPTVFVSEEQLREEYGFVVTDIRNMFILTGILIVVLAILAQFI